MHHSSLAKNMFAFVWKERNKLENTFTVKVYSDKLKNGNHTGRLGTYDRR